MSLCQNLGKPWAKPRLLGSKIQAKFKGHLILCNKNSKCPDGKKINDLEPYEMHIIPISLEDWETKVLAESMGDVINRKADSMLGDITSKAIYVQV